MKKLFIQLYTLGFVVSSCSAFAQQHASSGHLDCKEGHREGEHINYCGSLQYKQKLFRLNPAFEQQYKADRAKLKTHTEQFISNHPKQGIQRGSNYMIPVVFHVIHMNGSENISDEQISDQMRILNEDFNLLNADANHVQSTFQGLAADAQIEFRLARKKTDGTCFNGITRTYSNTTHTGSGAGFGHAQITAVRDAQGDYPGNEYMNVYIVAYANGSAGYTLKPFNGGGLGLSMYNGIVILNSYIGATGSSSSYRSRALTHEVGHWLNLDHPWGPDNNPGNASGCNVDDGVADTPNTIGNTSCTLSANTCSNETAGFWGSQNPIADPVDNVENYMEYAYCSKMFSQGQADRMAAALNANTGGRDNLVSASNMIHTGLDVSPALCKADFRAYNQVICAGETARFEDLSYHAVTGWNWTFPGSITPTSHLKNPENIPYNIPGTYDVSLQVTDGVNAQSVTFQDYITVLPVAGAPEGPRVEGFESGTNLPNNKWLIENTDMGPQWEVTNQAAYSGSYSVKLSNYGSIITDGTDDLISNTIDMRNFTSVIISFRYAYAKRSSDNTERLRIYVSNTCGDGWSLRKQILGSDLETASTTSVPFTPNSDQWKYIMTDNIPSSYFVENFRVRFSFENDGGNNIYLDDIHISGTVGTGEREIMNAFNVFPNPATDNARINFRIKAAERVDIVLTDVVGKNVRTVAGGDLNAGEHNYPIPTSDLSSGIYVVRLQVGDRSYAKQLIVH